MNRRTDIFGSTQSWLSYSESPGTFVANLNIQFVPFPRSATTIGFNYSFSAIATSRIQTYIRLGAASRLAPQTFSIFDINPSDFLSVWTGLNNKYASIFNVINPEYPYTSNVWLSNVGPVNGTFYNAFLQSTFNTPPSVSDYFADFHQQIRASSVYTGMVSGAAAGTQTTEVEAALQSQTSESVIIEDLQSNSGYLVFLCFPGPGMFFSNPSLNAMLGTAGSFWYRPFEQQRPPMIDTIASGPSLQSSLSQSLQLDTSTIQIPSNYLAGEGNRPQ